MPLLLDLDNTLFGSVPAYEYAIARMEEHWENKGHGSREEFRKLYSHARKHYKKVLEHHTSNRLRLLYFKQMIEEKFGKLIPELALDMDRQYFTWFEEAVRIEQEEKKDMFHLLFKYLDEIALHDKIVLVTNETLRTQLLKLSFFLPENLPVKLVTSEEIGIEKPQPYIFRRAMELVDGKPEKCLMIGDNLKDDIGGAMNLGIHAIHLTAMFGQGHELVEKDLDGKRYLEADSIIKAVEYYSLKFVKLA